VFLATRTICLIFTTTQWLALRARWGGHLLPFYCRYNRHIHIYLHNIPPNVIYCYLMLMYCSINASKFNVSTQIHPLLHRKFTNIFKFTQNVQKITQITQILRKIHLFSNNILDKLNLYLTLN
jgi:hypothetical protein